MVNTENLLHNINNTLNSVKIYNTNSNNLSKLKSFENYLFKINTNIDLVDKEFKNENIVIIKLPTDNVVEKFVKDKSISESASLNNSEIKLNKSTKLDTSFDNLIEKTDFLEGPQLNLKSSKSFEKIIPKAVDPEMIKSKLELQFINKQK